MQKSNVCSPSRKGFTLIELLVVIAIIAILAAILFPVFAQAREKARQITCASNEKQLALGMLQYIQDYDEFFPLSDLDIPGEGVGWGNLIQPYLKSIDVYHCPDLTEGIVEAQQSQIFTATTTYNYNTILGFCNKAIPGMNSFLPSTCSQNVSYATQPASTIMFQEAFPYDASSGRPWGAGYQCNGPAYSTAINNGGVWGGGVVCGEMSFNAVPSGFNATLQWGSEQVHSGGANYAFCDGHVKWYMPTATYGAATPFSVSGSGPTLHINDGEPTT